MDFDEAQMLVAASCPERLAVRLGVLETAKSIIPYDDGFLCRHMEPTLITGNNFFVFIAFR